jgi:hypothetical protein
MNTPFNQKYKPYNRPYSATAQFDLAGENARSQFRIKYISLTLTLQIPGQHPKSVHSAEIQAEDLFRAEEGEQTGSGVV